MRLVITICCSLFTLAASAGPVADECYKALFSFPDLNLISTKIGLPDITKASFEQIATQDTATDEERAVIAKYAQGFKICVDEELKEMPADVHKGYASIISEDMGLRQTALIDLYNKKITYGQYIQARQRDKSLIDQKFAKLDAEVNANNAQIQQQQAAQKSRMWADFFGGMSKAFAPKPSVNCVPNGFGGMRCQ